MSYELEIKRLEQLMDVRFKSQDEKTTQALAFSKEAVDKADKATEKRFENVNEFRATLSDQATKFALKDEVNTKFTYMEKELASLRESKSETSGKSQTWFVIIGILFSILGSAIAIVIAMRVK